MDIHEQIESIKKEIRETPYHKGTEHHIGMLRARIARLKDKLIESESKRGGGGGGGYAVKKHGDATIVFVGPPSVGKSTLINKLTNARSKIAPYAFTTVTVIPGMMNYNEAKIQILDVPGLIEGAEEGKGRGREVLSVVRGANLLVLLTEPKKLEAFERIQNALERNGIRVNKVKPDVLVEKKLSGGIDIHTNIKQDLSKDTIKEVVSEMGYKNADITLKEKVSIDTLIDSLARNRVYINSIYVVNKSDTISKIPPTKNSSGESIDNPLYISAEKSINIDYFKELIWKNLKLLTVYLVKEDEEPNIQSPIIVRQGSTILDISQTIGEGFTEGKTHAVIWGPGSKFPGQDVSLNTKVQEGMLIRIL